MNLIGIFILGVLLVGGLAMAALTKRRWVRLAGLITTATSVAIAGFFLWQSDRWDRGFDQIHAGDHRDRVLELMGAPTEDTDATLGIYGSKRLVTGLISGYTEQYYYHSFFTPECWWIAFDAQGRVLNTYHYISP